MATMIDTWFYSVIHGGNVVLIEEIVITTISMIRIVMVTMK